MDAVNLTSIEWWTHDWVPKTTWTILVVLVILFLRFIGKKSINKYVIENASVQPMITLVGIDNWVEYTLRYVVEFKRRRKTKNDIFREIIAHMRASQGRVRMASATYEIVGLPEVSLRMNPGIQKNQNMASSYVG